MKTLWRFGGALAILGGVLAVAGMALGMTMGGVWINEQAFPEAFLQAIVEGPAFWTARVLLTTILPPLLLLIANGALFHYLGRDENGAARIGLWVGTAGLTLLLLVGALQYVAYPRLAAAYLSDPATALDVFRPLRLLDHALQRFGPLIGLGIPALLAAFFGWRARQLSPLVILLGLIVFAVHLADLALNYQVFLLNGVAFGVTVVWTLVYGVVLLLARGRRAPADAQDRHVTAADRSRQRRPHARESRPAPPPDDAGTAEPSTPPDPYTTLLDEDDEANQEKESKETGKDEHTRWRPPPEYKSPGHRRRGGEPSDR